MEARVIHSTDLKEQAETILDLKPITCEIDGVEVTINRNLINDVNFLSKLVATEDNGLVIIDLTRELLGDSFDNLEAAYIERYGYFRFDKLTEFFQACIEIGVPKND